MFLALLHMGLFLLHAPQALCFVASPTAHVFISSAIRQNCDFLLNLLFATALLSIREARHLPVSLEMDAVSSISLT